jgi:multidrug efflux pump subunit AcrB
MWEFFITKSRFTYLLVIVLIGAGLYAMLTIPRESAPEVQIPIGVVTTVLPGAPATDVESLITNELERGLIGSLEDVKEITSTSRESVSSIVVEFNASADLEASLADLKDKVDELKVGLPSDAEDPTVTEVNFNDQPVLTFTVSGDASPATFFELSQTLERELESLPGISRVTYSGVGEREISVLVTKEALVQYNITLSDISNAIRASNLAFPIGQIQSDNIVYNVTFDGKPSNSTDIENIAITTRNGQPVYVRDVARVNDTVAESPTLSRVSVSGEPTDDAVSFNVFKQRGGDITAITGSVIEKLDAFQADGALLENYTVLTVLDSGDQIKKDLVNLSSSGLMTVALVILILVVALGWREAFVAGLAVPLSFLIGFIGLSASGNTINFLSLFSLILGIGILVDSGIVMVEGINRRMKDNPTIDKREAARLAVREFTAPLISGTLTTVGMFAGLLVVSGVTGEFIKSIPYTLIFILFASLFVALAVLPVIAASVLRRRSATKMEQKQYEYTQTLENWYRGKLELIIGNSKRERTFMWSIRGLLVVAILLPVIGLVQVVFFEQADIEFIFVDVELAEGSSKNLTDVAVRRVEEVLYQEPDIASFVTTVGGGNQFTGGGSGEKLSSIFILLEDERELTSTELTEKLRKQYESINDYKVVVSQPNNGPPVGSPIGVTFSGDDLDELVTLANQATILLSEIPNTTNIKTSINAGTEFVVELDIARAAAFDLSAQSVSGILRSAVFGTEATSLTSPTSEIPVQVQLNLSDNPDAVRSEANQVSIDTVRALPLLTRSGESIPLSSVADIRLQEARTVINHEDGVRVVTISADISAAGNVREIQTQFEGRVKNELTIPASVTFSGGGESGESDQAFIELFLALIVGVVLMVGVLVLQFNSYLHMRYVLSILPYSLIGIFFGLAITQNPLSFPSIMGFIALSGIVVNNSILLIDVMNQDRRKNPTKAIRDVVIDSAVHRIRPILLTTITTVIGMVPLIFSGDLWAPLAYAVMFGLIFSVIITLVLIPVIYHRKPGTLN